MNIVKDPVYSDNPALLEAFKSDAQEQDARLLTQQRTLESQAAELKQQASDLVAKQRSVLITLCVALLLLVVGVGLIGIVVTHKIAGPVFKMKRHLREVADGRLIVPSALRKGDELVDFFETFDRMVKSLRARQEREIALLDAAIARAEGSGGGVEIEPLRQLRKDMQAALD
jgi:nitrogen fixation/metabolism regulation signal transduction histidine kinase